MDSKRVLIVGGVAGGASCAARLRRLDEQAQIFMFERGADVSFANCGLPYYVGGVINDRQSLLVATPERFRDWFNVEVRTRHEVQSIDRQARTIEVRNLQTGNLKTERYDELVLSPGATPIRPSLPGLDLPGVFGVRNLQDVDQITQWITRRNATRAVVVGGGYIGLEMVENLVHRGMDVTLLELLDQVMPQMDAEMVVPIHNLLREKGVGLQLGNGVAALEQAPGDSLAVIAKNGERITADLVIMAVGVKPDVKLALEADLEIGPTGGIRVDGQMRTSDPHIFAVGDAAEVRDWVTGTPILVPLAGPANRQGRLVADVISGRDREFRGVQGTSVVGLFGWTVASTGANEKRLLANDVVYRKMYVHANHHAGYYPGAEPMALKILFDPESGRLLGAQAVGTAGVDKRIDVLAMAMQKHATVFDLEEAELCYAPQFGSAKDPVNLVGAAAANAVRGDVDVVYWEDWLTAQNDAQAQPVVVDVRNPDELASGSVPGARNIPLGELRMRLEELPRDREIWVHCGVGQRSYYASRILRQQGFQTRNLSGGLKSYHTVTSAAKR
jgi:NADPH-dependent 2,4-dienoyl-CoA reductase/sulfur reductase-like enzyme/rhodanese-related sulfurtransferase